MKGRTFSSASKSRLGFAACAGAAPPIRAAMPAGSATAPCMKVLRRVLMMDLPFCFWPLAWARGVRSFRRSIGPAHALRRTLAHPAPCPHNVLPYYWRLCRLLALYRHLCGLVAHLLLGRGRLYRLGFFGRIAVGVFARVMRAIQGLEEIFPADQAIHLMFQGRIGPFCGPERHRLGGE